MNWWKIIVEVIGLILYLYFSWRILRENYKEEDVIAFSWVSLLLILIFSRVTYGLVNWGVWVENPIRWLEFWKINESMFLGGYGIWLLLVWLVCSDRGWKYWSFAEDNILSLLWISLIFVILSNQWWLLVGLGLVLISWLLLRKKYRSFTWYRSGKKGFLFFAGNILLFLYMAIFTKIIWLALPALICVVGLVMLGNDKFSK
jgi:hypothetical protein